MSKHEYTQCDARVAADAAHAFAFQEEVAS
jgi:hypothetical protein